MSRAATIGLVMFAIASPAVADPTLIKLAPFHGSDGSQSQSALIADGAGNLFGTTCFGGANGSGTVFELQKGAKSVTTLVTFNGTNGANPSGPLFADSLRNLYGTTYRGGTKNV